MIWLILTRGLGKKIQVLLHYEFVHSTATFVFQTKQIESGRQMQGRLTFNVTGEYLLAKIVHDRKPSPALNKEGAF